ncbi:MAG: sulfotransferase [Ilumatobacter sp.]
MPNPLNADMVRGIARRGIRFGAMATARWRPSPDLIIIGVKRGGTTSLFRDLEQHPAMCPLVPSARRLPLRENQKGVHFFDTGFERGDRFYRSHFPTEPVLRRRRQLVGAAFTAEASPYYFFQPLAAQRVANALPHARFALLLRDPVERTISHWSEQTRNGVETLSLAEALEAEADRVGDDGERLARGELDVSHAHEQQTFAAQSMYSDSLQRWFDAVGRDRITVGFSEDYYRDAATVIRPITDGLGLDPIPDESVGDHRNAAPRAATLDAALERQLINRFRPDVDALTDLLGARPPWPRFGLQSNDPTSDEVV